MAAPESPFSQSQRKLSFGLDWMLLLTLVAATTATLVGYAMFLPTVTSEVDAWLGRSVDMGDPEENRRIQMYFVLMCYSAPMLLGLMVRLVHLGGTWLAGRLSRPRAEDEEFRME